MRVLFLGNNWTAWKVLDILKECGDDVVGLIVHPEDKRRYGDEILQVANVNSLCVFDGSRLQEREIIDAIEVLGADIAVSVLFGYILRTEFIDLFPSGVINLHPSYLPYNRGEYPNVWSIVENTPAGVTLHYIDEGVDTGDIIAQQLVPVDLVDTGVTLYGKLEKACVDIFRKNWPSIRSGNVARNPQDKQRGTYHRARDVESIDPIDLERKYSAKELIDLIRARTFPPFPGAYFTHNGRKVYLRLQLIDEERFKEEDYNAIH